MTRLGSDGETDDGRADAIGHRLHVTRNEIASIHAIDATAPKGIRLHIGLFGRRNVGKSSLLNALTRQEVSIVSDVAGTTTDPVEKPMELLPLGPVLFIDTAGIDDAGALGEMRVPKTRQVFDRTDVGMLVVAAGRLGRVRGALLARAARRGRCR